jgi:hypothetical protein
MCFNKVHKVAEYVNERKRYSENAQKMLEIQEHLVDTKVNKKKKNVDFLGF